ncbi:MAG: RNA methyltransferase, partial [Bacteroidota bacterium]
MQTLSKAKVRLFNALQTKKGRYKERRFVIEGKKMVAEAMASDWTPELLVLRDDVADNGLTDLPAHLVCVADTKTFGKISNLQQPEGILALMKMPAQIDFPAALPAEAGFLLDAVQDPGNLGSIIRIA